MSACRSAKVSRILTRAERPLSTAYACETLTTGTKQEPVLSGGIKAEFTDGLVPIRIDFLDPSHAKTEFDLVITSLEISWYQVPTRTVSLEASTEVHANDIFQAVNGQAVCALKLKCDLTPPEHGQPWTVLVTNATESMTHDEILSLLPRGLAKPRKMHFGAVVDQSASGIEVIKNRIGEMTNRAVTRTNMLESIDMVKHKAVVWFKGGPNLEMLARSLNGQRFVEFGNSPVYVCERLDVGLWIDRGCYSPKLMMRRLDELAKHFWHADESVRIRYGECPGPHRIYIGMQATSRQQLLRAKAAIGADLIHFHASAPHLRPPLPPLPDLRAHHRSLNPTQVHHIRPGKTTAYQRVVNGGLREAEEAAGKDAVELDASSDPPAVVVRGETDLLRKVQSVLVPEEKVQHDIDCMRQQDNTATCEVCWEIIQCDDMVNVSACGHVCCRDCFVNYCTVDASLKFPLRCFHVNCSKPLPLSPIVASLESAVLLDLMQQAVDDHFARHPRRYAQCPGTDCSAYYELDTGEDEHICLSCCTVVCIKCKIEQHFGETCQDYQYRITCQLPELELWMEASGAKRCKRCSTVMQKDVGCNNMQCLGCRAHFCFTCMEILPTHEAVYVHMHEQHGNYGDEEALELQEQVERGHYEAAEREHYEAALDRPRINEGERRQYDAARDLRIHEAEQVRHVRGLNLLAEARDMADRFARLPIGQAAPPPPRRVPDDERLEGPVPAEVPAAQPAGRPMWHMGPRGRYRRERR